MIHYIIYYGSELCLEGNSSLSFADLLQEYDPFQNPEYFYGVIAVSESLSAEYLASEEEYDPFPPYLAPIA